MMNQHWVELFTTYWAEKRWIFTVDLTKRGDLLLNTRLDPGLAY